MKNSHLYVILILVVLVLFGIYYSGQTKTLNLNTSIIVSNPSVLQKIKNISTSPQALVAQKEQSIIDLQNEINKYIRTQNGEWGIVVRDLKTNEVLSINENISISGASTTKILTAVAVFKKLEASSYNLNTYVSGKTIKNHLTLMVNQSNNNSWNTLNFWVGFDYMQNLGTELGMHDFNISTNQVNPDSMEKLLYSLYTKPIITEADKIFLYSLMQNTIVEDRISAGVPKGTIIYHKHGDYLSNYHDIGIVMGTTPYTIVVMGTNTTKEGGTRTIAGVSKIVYEYLNQNSAR
ncbi:hypothetical protein COV24_01590 [candidate division WWE3 bacterium CG10_big_fil_rev_8_21_14_0_10_32_10]|uniref:Beta-lactamase class A catalytic domain-containing protein n=1 Tax=candidate division WWE3 bacterium CG10_big_fil_rev_8_21_14_0_10_32_10 TaxID=1975090 RepID=A0A2H0RB33_UNCKA|nr:MAG: hypothetical protein COV24_01590 [candidate division WWE3 bacterium CG10_big_fil_rev_8_21_14_0_10_32_10]